MNRAENYFKKMHCVITEYFEEHEGKKPECDSWGYQVLADLEGDIQAYLAGKKCEQIKPEDWSGNFKIED